MWPVSHTEIRWANHSQQIAGKQWELQEEWTVETPVFQHPLRILDCAVNSQNGFVLQYLVNAANYGSLFQ